jgi:hypothetical protein
LPVEGYPLVDDDTNVDDAGTSLCAAHVGF